MGSVLKQFWQFCTFLKTLLSLQFHFIQKQSQYSNLCEGYDDVWHVIPEQVPLTCIPTFGLAEGGEADLMGLKPTRLKVQL